MENKSPGHLFQKLFFSYSAVLILICLLYTSDAADE